MFARASVRMTLGTDSRVSSPLRFSDCLVPADDDDDAGVCADVDDGADTGGDDAPDADVNACADDGDGAGDDGVDDDDVDGATGLTSGSAISNFTTS